MTLECQLGLWDADLCHPQSNWNQKSEIIDKYCLVRFQGSGINDTFNLCLAIRSFMLSLSSILEFCFIHCLAAIQSLQVVNNLSFLSCVII